MKSKTTLLVILSVMLTISFLGCTIDKKGSEKASSSPMDFSLTDLDGTEVQL